MSEDSSSIDIDRSEEKWSTVNEDFLEKIATKCESEMVHHQIRGLCLKRLYYVLSLSNIVLPLLQVIPSFLNTETQTVLLYITPMAVAFQTLLDPSRRSENHYNFEHKYQALFLKIRKQLVRGKRYRQAFDVFLESCTISFSNLQDISPK